MNSKQILRAYSIKEVSKIINTPTGTIRQWEKDLNGLLVIPRTQQGARYYTDKEISMLNKIKEMREQNVNKGMIRTLLEKHLKHDHSEPTSELSEITSEASKEAAIPPTNELSLQPQNESNTNNVELLYTAMAEFKQNLLNEIKHELSVSKHDLMDKMKNEVTNSSLLTVKEISKSIQRSNDKQKANVQEISHMIMKASEYTSETFEVLSEDIQKSSEATYEKLSERIIENAKLTDRRNQRAMEKVANRFKETQENIIQISNSFHSQQKAVMESLNELKQSQEEIQKREEIFQSMIAGYREVASAKKERKKWWKFWASNSPHRI